MKPSSCDIVGFYLKPDGTYQKVDVRSCHVAYAVVTGSAVFPWADGGYLTNKLKLYSTESHAKACLTKLKKNYPTGNLFKHPKVVSYVVA
jgi:hypothetical protein